MVVAIGDLFDLGKHQSTLVDETSVEVGNMKKLILIVVLLVVGYYGLRAVSAYSFVKQYGKCAVQVNSGGRLQAAKTDRERSEIKHNLLDCVEKNLAFPGSLGYDSKKFRDDANSSSHPSQTSPPQ